MFIKQITLEGHPLIRECEIRFSIPNGTMGSGLNYVVGQSGTGKTKLLEIISSGYQNRPPSPGIGKQPIERSLYKATVFDETGKENSKIGGLIVLYPDHPPKINRDYLFSSEEHEETTATGKPHKILRTRNRSGNYYPKTFANSGVGEALFNNLMEQIVNGPAAINASIQIVAIEEAEAYLDPENQVKLLKALATLATNKQVFISTHSPYIIDWDYLENGASIIKMNRSDNESTVGVFCDHKVAKAINKPGRRNPHLNGVESKNIFFTNKIFVTEGQEDVGLIGTYLNEKAIDQDFAFFGYGAGSNSKIRNVLELCAQLKIPKAAALFDASDSAEYKICVDKYKHYKIMELIADDIRDKPETGASEIKALGAFEYESKKEKYTLKNDTLGKDFEEKITAIVDYFHS